MAELEVVVGDKTGRSVSKTLGEAVVDDVEAILSCGTVDDYSIRSTPSGIVVEAYFYTAPRGDSLNALREKYDIREVGVTHDEETGDNGFFVIIHSERVVFEQDVVGEAITSFIQYVTGNETMFMSLKSEGEIVNVETRSGFTGDELDVVFDSLDVLTTYVNIDEDGDAWYGLEIDVVDL